MKISSILTVLVLFSLCLSCDNDEFPDDPFSIKGTTYGSCKPITKSVIEEYLLVSVTDNYFLEVKHINALFNCAPGEIIVEGTCDGVNIFLNEYETEGYADCICPYDISFTIGPMNYGIYTFILQRGGFEVFRDQLVFNSETDKRIDIKVH